MENKCSENVKTLQPRGKQNILGDLTWKIATSTIILRTHESRRFYGTQQSASSITTLSYVDSVVPALKDALRLYDPSMAASKDRIVSSGRSMRDLVGLDKSGSAG